MRLKNFDCKVSDIRSKCMSEIEELFKESVENGCEERINIDEGDGSAIRMADEYEDYFEYITSIVGKVEDDNVEIKLYFNENENYYRRRSFSWDLDDCYDVEAIIKLYKVVFFHFYE